MRQWLGASMVNQAEYDRDKGKLTQTPARTRFISFEPLLETIDVGDDLAGIHCAIVGGESVPHSRPLRSGAVERLHDQCDTAGGPFFFKQWGGAGKDKGGCILGSEEFKAWPIPG